MGSGSLVRICFGVPILLKWIPILVGTAVTFCSTLPASTCPCNPYPVLVACNFLSYNSRIILNLWSHYRMNIFLWFWRRNVTWLISDHRYKGWPHFTQKLWTGTHANIVALILVLAFRFEIFYTIFIWFTWCYLVKSSSDVKLYYNSKQINKYFDGWGIRRFRTCRHN